MVPPLPENAAFWAPIKVMVAPAVPRLVAKSSVPSLIRFPPTKRSCVVTVPVAADSNVPPLTIVTFAPTLSERAVTASNCRMPDAPSPTVSV